MFVANVAVITSVACDLDTKLGCVETYMSCQLKPGGQETWDWIFAISADLPRSRSSRFNQSLHGAGFWLTWCQRIGINDDIEACKKQSHRHHHHHHLVAITIIDIINELVEREVQLGSWQLVVIFSYFRPPPSSLSSSSSFCAVSFDTKNRYRF